MGQGFSSEQDIPTATRSSSAHTNLSRMFWVRVGRRGGLGQSAQRGRQKNALYSPAHSSSQFYIGRPCDDPAIIRKWRDCSRCSRSRWWCFPARPCRCIFSRSATAKWWGKRKLAAPSSASCGPSTRADEKGIANTGCTVTVESVVNRYPDGRFDVMTRGRRRFQIVSLDDEKSYLRGEVEYFDDETIDIIPADLLDRALEAHQRLHRTARLGQSATAAISAFSWLKGLRISISAASCCRAVRSYSGCVCLLNLWTGYIPRRQYTDHMKVKAPTNGSGHKRPGV